MPQITCEATCTSKTKSGQSKCSLGAKYLFPEGVGYRCLTHAKKLTSNPEQYKIGSTGTSNNNSSANTPNTEGNRFGGRDGDDDEDSGAGSPFGHVSSSPALSSSSPASFPGSSDFVMKKIRKSRKNKDGNADIDMKPSVAIEIHEISTGKYEAFSNLYSHPVIFKGITWNSAENAYQGMRFYWSSTDESTNDAITNVLRALVSVSAKNAREIGNLNTRLERADWNQRGNGAFSVGERFLFEILIVKFSSPSLRDLLLSTGRSHITIHSSEKGETSEKLGEILMAVREYLRIEQISNGM